MVGVEVLPWLLTKDEDAGEDRQHMDLESVSGREPGFNDSAPWLVVKYRAKRAVRQAVRYLDMQCILLWRVLKERPVLRLSWIAYAIAVHVLLIALFLR